MTREEYFNKDFIMPRLEENGHHTWDFHTSDLEDAMKWADEHPKSPWIKCSDKLPEEIDCETIIISPYKKREWTVSDDVLVQDNHGNVYVDRLVNGKWTVKYEPDYDGNEYVVVAWMPIPEFKEE